MVLAVMFLSTVIMATIIGYTAALCFNFDDSPVMVGVFIAIALTILIYTSWSVPERYSVIGD